MCVFLSLPDSIQFVENKKQSKQARQVSKCNRSLYSDEEFALCSLTSRTELLFDWFILLYLSFSFCLFFFLSSLFLSLYFYFFMSLFSHPLSISISFNLFCLFLLTFSISLSIYTSCHVWDLRLKKNGPEKMKVDLAKIYLQVVCRWRWFDLLYQEIIISRRFQGHNTSLPVNDVIYQTQSLMTSSIRLKCIYHLYILLLHPENWTVSDVK